MPTYTYICEQCHQELDVWQKISEEPLQVCPRCEQPALRRKIGGGAGLIFKGSGFYITDYRSENYKQKAQTESNTACATASKG